MMTLNGTWKNNNKKLKSSASSGWNVRWRSGKRVEKVRTLSSPNLISCGDDIFFGE